MELLLTISLNIIIIGWAFIVILWIFVLFIVINILSKVNYITKDMIEKYDFIVWTMFKPINIIMHFINKLKKNG